MSTKLTMSEVYWSILLYMYILWMKLNDCKRIMRRNPLWKNTEKNKPNGVLPLHDNTLVNKSKVTLPFIKLASEF